MRKPSDANPGGVTGAESRYLDRLRRLLSKTKDADRKLILKVAQEMAKR